MDILSLVNSHGYEPAYLLIGVKNDGTLFDVSHFHYEDATFQQIIGSGIEPRVDFVYTPLGIEGKRIGAITIQPSNQRFHVLLKDCPDDKGDKFAHKGETRIKVGTSKNRPTAYDYQRLRESVLQQAVRQPHLHVSFDDGSSLMEFEPSMQTVPNYHPLVSPVGVGGGGGGFGLGRPVSTSRSEKPARRNRTSPRLHIVVSNMGRAPAETVIIELIASPNCESGFDPSHPQEGWKVVSSREIRKFRFTCEKVLHNDRVMIVATTLPLPLDNTSYEIEWKAFAANADEVRHGVLVINCGQTKDDTE